MFTQKSVFFEWPFLPGHPTVRRFENVGPFTVSQIGDEWRVLDTRHRNKNGCPDPAQVRRFTSREAAEEFVRTAG